MKIIYNRKVKNYLAKYNYFPVFEEEETAYYKKSRRLSELLERYYIESVCIPNKLA